MKKNLILVGGGGHARACIDVIESTNLFNIIGYLDFHSILDESFGVPYLGDDQKGIDYIGTSSFIICIGQIKSANLRVRSYQYLKSKNAFFPIIISATSYVSKYSVIGEGSIIMHKAIIQAGVSVGHNCIINDGVIIEHDVKISDHVHLSTGVILNGGVKVDSGVFIGSGSIIRNNIHIKKNAIIGMGSVITKDVSEGQVVFGNPGKIKL